MNNDHVFDKSKILSFYRIKYFKINISKYKEKAMAPHTWWAAVYGVAELDTTEVT